MYTFTIGKLSLPAIGLIIMIGCAKKPIIELTEAENAIKSAIAVEARQYAVYELDVAQSMYSAALDEVKRQDAAFVVGRDYSRAREMLQNAANQASAAKNCAIAGKQRMATAMQKHAIPAQ